MGALEGSAEILSDVVLDAKSVGKWLGSTDGWLLCVLVSMLVDGDSISESKIELK